MFAVLVVAVIIAFAAVATVLQNKATSTPTTTTSTSTGTTTTSNQSTPDDNTSSTNSATSSQCSEPCVWTRVVDSQVYSDAISSDDSVVAVGTGSSQTSGGIVLFNNQGAVLWNHTVDYTVSSISISSNGSYIAAGGYQQMVCCGGAYTNGAVFLFDRAGNLLWNVTGSDPVFKVQFSADASSLAVRSGDSISDLSINGSQSWNYTTPSGFVSGMDMDASGNYLVASAGYLGSHTGSAYGWSFLAFDGQGKLLWNYTAADGEEPQFITTSSNGTYTWASSAFGGSNGSLYLFNQEGSLLWKQQIYSPGLVIQTAGNLYANVFTNSGNLIYNVTGALLENITSPSSVATSVTTSSTSATSTSCAPPSFWTSYWTGPDEAAVLFLGSTGNVVSTYSFAGGVPNATLSTDQLYAVVAGYQNSSLPTAGFSIVFLSFGQAGLSCK